jgi:RHS repeat-associated protein
MLDVKSYSFYHRSSTTGYTNYQLLVNGIFVGSGSIFVSSGSTLQSTGTINVANAIAGLTGSVTVTLKLFGGSNGNNATFRLDDFTLNGYTQEVQIYAENYRRGFNGMEKDDEVKGGGNSYDFGSRIYDSRVARFLSLDPRLNDFPFMSPYCFAANNPIRNVDINGEGPGDRIKAALKFLGTPYKQEYEYEGKTRTYLRTGSDEKGLEKMDCSELVCRVLAADMLTNGVKSMATTNLIKYFDDNADTWEKSETPQSGDVLLWNGHTGIVESYDAENKKVFVIHATSYISNKKNVHSVVQESYSLSYYEKKGAFFYRPKKEQDNNIYESKKEIGEISIKGNSGNLPKLKTNTISNISSKNGEVKINENDDKTEKK